MAPPAETVITPEAPVPPAPPEPSAHSWPPAAPLGPTQSWTPAPPEPPAPPVPPAQSPIPAQPEPLAPLAAAAQPDEAAEPDIASPEDAVEPETGRRRRSRRARGSSGQGRERTLVGLDIEPGLLVAVKSRVNGGLIVEQAAYAPISLDIVRDGEVNNVEALAEALKELFATSGLERRVRIGIANQRIMMRRIELPPLTDAAEIEQAVRFQAPDEIPMPLESVVLDYRSLGIIDGEAGPRLHVLLVAARRDMVERVLHASRLAGLQPEGVDLAAFGMVRALRPLDAGPTEQILYLSIGGLTNLAISHGMTCEFTRVIGAGVEQIAANVASRCAVPITEARSLLSTVGAEDAVTPVPPVQATPALAPTPPVALEQTPPSQTPAAPEPYQAPGYIGSTPSPSAADPYAPPLVSDPYAAPTTPDRYPPPPEPPAPASPYPPPPAASYPPPAATPEPPAAAAYTPPAPAPAPARTSGLESFVGITPEHAKIARTALAEGIRRIADEVRNSLDFYLASQGDEPITRGVLCGPALEIPGFEVALSRELGIQVARGEVELGSPGAAGDVPLSLLAVAAGLSVPEGPQ